MSDVHEDNGSPDTSNEVDDAFLERAARYLDDNLDAQGVASLEQELLNSEVKRQWFAEIMYTDALARESMVGQLDPSSATGLGDAVILPALGSEGESYDDEEAVVEAPELTRAPEPPAPRWHKWRSAAAIALLAVGGAMLWWLTRDTSGATVVASIGAQQPAISVGTVFRSGSEVSVNTGYVQLRFDDGTKVVMEGPSRVSIVSGHELALTSGQVAVEMPKGMKGFAVKTAAGVVTDLGTEFLVKVDPATPKAAEVQVFSGKVHVASADAAITREVTAGDLAQMTGASQIKIEVGGAKPQLFVRDLVAPAPSKLDVVDLLNGGNGTTNLRGNLIEATTGHWGNLKAVSLVGGSGQYMRVPKLPVVDGCFVPLAAGGMTAIDSSGRMFNVPPNNGSTYLHITAGGKIPVPAGADEISTVLNGVDYAAADHGLVLIHPNLGLTLDLDVVRRLYPQTQLTAFRCIVGNPHPKSTATRCDIAIIVDGKVMFEQKGFTTQDLFSVDIPIANGQRFMTFLTTDGGDGISADDVTLGDPIFVLGSGKPGSDGK